MDALLFALINFTRCIRNVQYLCFNINSILSTDCVTIHGIEYRAGSYLYIGESALYPSFGSVKEILVIKDEKFFAIQPLKTLLL